MVQDFKNIRVVTAPSILGEECTQPGGALGQSQKLSAVIDESDDEFGFHSFDEMIGIRHQKRASAPFENAEQKHGHVKTLSAQVQQFWFPGLKIIGERIRSARIVNNNRTFAGPTPDFFG